MKKRHGKNSTESQTIIDPAGFTREMMSALQKAVPDLKIEIPGDLRLKLHTADGRGLVVYLDNPYQAYQTRPLAKKGIIGDFVSGYISVLTAKMSERIDRAHILPLLKQRAWLTLVRGEAELRGATNPQEVHRAFIDDLVIVYVVDMPEHMIFVDGQQMAALGLDGEGLHKLAVENLGQQFPSARFYREDGVYRFTCGGIYDASLVLLDRFPNMARSKVSGDLIVAVPAKDCLLVAGSEDKEIIRKLSEMVQAHFLAALHPLSPKLLVCRPGLFRGR